LNVPATSIRLTEIIRAVIAIITPPHFNACRFAAQLCTLVIHTVVWIGIWTTQGLILALSRIRVAAVDCAIIEIVTTLGFAIAGAVRLTYTIVVHAMVVTALLVIVILATRRTAGGGVTAHITLAGAALRTSALRNAMRPFEHQ
jgi:hypothetical protein